MNMFSKLASLGIATLALSGSVAAQHHAEAHRHPQAAKLKNPNPPTADSIAAGHAAYDTHCAECHGKSGKGDGQKGEGLTEKPSNFTDDKWEHGTTDGELFIVIRDGAGPKSEMKGFAKKLEPKEMWDVVNFVRTLHAH